jgi:hypothetical protein
MPFKVACHVVRIFLLLSIRAIAPIEFPDDFPPFPPRLTRSTNLPTDPCRELCFEFKPWHRGFGYDLCDHPDLSLCVYDPTLRVGNNFCEHLYWSRTETGEPGLVYSRNETELTIEEIQHPLSCEDAHRIARDEYV